MAKDKPWHDEKTLEKLYWDKRMSTTEIGDELGCSSTTIMRWMGGFEIPTRDQKEAAGQHNYSKPAHYRINKDGHEIWQSNCGDESFMMQVHRLLAISEFGPKAVKGKFVHHKNGVPWDNRPENLQLMEPGEHTRYHHENGDIEADKNYQ
jgi:hypothetical protein